MECTVESRKFDGTFDRTSDATFDATFGGTFDGTSNETFDKTFRGTLDISDGRFRGPDLSACSVSDANSSICPSLVTHTIAMSLSLHHIDFSSASRL